MADLKAKSDTASKKCFIDFDVPSMRKDQVRSIVTNLIVTAVLAAFYFLYPNADVYKIVSLILVCYQTVMLLAGIVIYITCAKRSLVDDVLITDDTIYIDRDIYSLADKDISFTLSGGIRFDPGNLTGCFLEVKNSRTKRKKIYWIGPKRHFDTAYKREQLMDEILEGQAENNVNKDPVTFCFPVIYMLTIGVFVPIASTVIGLFLAIFGCMWLAEYGLFGERLYYYYRRRPSLSVVMIPFGIALVVFGIVYILHNLAHFTSMARKITISDEGITVNGEFFDYKSYPDVQWECVAFSRSFNLFDCYLCIAGRRYWTGNQWMNKCGIATSKVRNATLRMNPYAGRKSNDNRKF